MINLFKAVVHRDTHRELEKVLRSGYIGEGAQVKKFERLLSDYLGGYVVLVNSCTSAMHLAYHMADVNKREVISTPMTCLATNTPIVQNGGKIVWADVDPETGNIDPESVAKRFTKKTAAVVCVHYGGNLCDNVLVGMCIERGVPLIEDCAHLIRPGIGDAQCFSFQAIKFVTTGDGGALVVKDKKAYERAKLLRWYGINREAGETMRCMNPVNEVGYKFHMNDISATIGLCNWKNIPDIISKTRRHAEKYNAMFAGRSNIRTVPAASRNDYWLYILKVKNRDKFRDYMMDCGVETSLVHARNDIQPIFKAFERPLPGLEQFWKEQVCIPVGWWLKDSEIEYIADKVIQYDEEICAS